jgi:hypothetical protein
MTNSTVAAVAALSLSTFQTAVAEKVAGCNDAVLDRVVDHFAEQEANRRVPLILKGLEEVEKAEKALTKLKPENTYNEAGDVISSYWTRGGLDGKKKAEETLKKWQEALGKAITESDYAQLEKLVKSGGNAPAKDAPAAD